MKNAVLKIVSIIALLAPCSALPYSFTHNPNSQIGKVDVFVFKEPDAFVRYLRAMSAPDEVQAVAEKIAGTAVAVGAVLAIPTEGISVLLAGGVATGVGITKAFNKYTNELGIRSWFFRNVTKLIPGQDTGLIPAFHGDMPPGTTEAWNWKEIQDVLKISPNDATPLYFVITARPSDGNAFIPYEGKMRSDAAVNFSIVKEVVTDPNTKQQATIYRVGSISGSLDDHTKKEQIQISK